MEQRGYERNVFFAGLPRFEPGTQLPGPLGCRMGPGGADVELNLPDHRIEWRLDRVRGAEETQAPECLARQALLQLREQPGLSNPWLAGDEHHPPLAVARLPPTA